MARARLTREGPAFPETIPQPSPEIAAQAVGWAQGAAMHLTTPHMIRPSVNGAVKRAAAGALALAVMSALAGAGTGAAATTLSAGGSPPAAGTAAWSVVPSANTTAPADQLAGVSCVTASLCTGVGYRISSSGKQLPLAQRWNGHTWAIQPTPGTGSLTSVSCPSASACLAVGGGLAERWNGATWTALPAPAGGSLASVSCISVSACTAVGTSGVFGSFTPFAASWDGTAWTVHPAPGAATSSGLSGVSCLAGGNCIAVGFAITSSDDGDFEEDALAESWDGTAWAIQPTPSLLSDVDLAAVSCTSATACAAVGNSDNDLAVTARWNGSRWGIGVQVSHEGPLNGVWCTSATACIAVGDAATGGGSLPRAERWNGTGWTRQSVPGQGAFGGLAAVSCTSASACTAAGNADGINGGEQALAERWNGQKWAIQTTSNPRVAQPNLLSGVSCATTRQCETVGSVTSLNNPAGDFGTPIAAHWNGSRWTQQHPSPFPGTAASSLNAVSCSSATACIAMGGKQDATLNNAFAKRWNGHRWAQQHLPNPTKGKFGGIERFLLSVSCSSASACTAVGGYTPDIHADFPTNTLAERWNGKHWTIQATPVLATTVFQSAQLGGVSCPGRRVCVAVGQGPSGGALAERWNGSKWTVRHPPGHGMLTGVSCTSASACTAVGGNLAERWNGSTWVSQHLAVPTGASSVIVQSVACSSRHACTAVGYYGISPTRHTLIESWNGTKWSIQRAPDVGQLMSVSCRPIGACFAVGETNSGHTLIEHRP